MSAARTLSRGRRPAGLPAHRGAVLERWERDGTFFASIAQREDQRDVGRRRGVRVLRRAAVRQRPAALRAPAHRVRQGRRAALPHDARPGRPPPLRLGLPRPAGRGRGREGARHRRAPGDHRLRHRRLQRRLPHERAALHRRVGALRRAARPAGSTSRTTTRPSTSTTWRASCGPSSRSGTRA